MTIAPLVSESVTVSGSAPSIEATPAAGSDQRQRPRHLGAAARQPDAGARERRRREPGVRRTGRRAGDPRPRPRPHADPDRRRARQLRAARRPERDVSRSDGRRRHRRGARPGLGRVRIGRVRRRDLGAHAPRGRRARRCRRSSAAPSAPAFRSGAAGFELSKGLAQGRRAVRGAHPRRRRLGQPGRRGLQLRLQRSRLPRPRRACRPARHVLGVVAERLRPRHRAAAQQLAHGPLLLSHRGLAPLHHRIRGRQRRRDSSGSASPGSSAPSTSAPIRIASRPRRPAARIERADISAKDFHVRGFGVRLLGKARVEMGVDVNGRFGLNAVDDLITYDLAGTVVSTRAQRLDRYREPDATPASTPRSTARWRGSCR